MDMIDTGAPQDLPRCIESDAQGRHCRERVVWDHVNKRPISTRCQAHGGLMDAALMHWHPTDGTETSGPK